MLLVGLLLGCPGRRPDVAEEVVLGTTPSRAIVPSAGADGAAVGPGRWVGAGLALVVPAGFAGREGPDDGALRLRLRHAESGVDVEIWTFTPEGPPTPRPRPDCRLEFQDAARHDIVPAFDGTALATCLPDDPADPVVFGWYGRLGALEVHVEALVPPGQMIAVEGLISPLLDSLSAG